MLDQLKVSKELYLPLELAARTQCIFAQKGAGKSYAAGVMIEELLDSKVQVCVLDPTGVFWGIQSTATGGKSKYDIVIMGGSHADVPLEPDAGEIVANFLVETGQSVVLDVSQFETQAAQDRFALALATKLYRLKAHEKSNIHIFLDEADQFCPLKPQRGQEKLLHAWDTIVRLGRSRGLGLTAISQRPAVVHTNIRNNVDLLTCLRVTGINDFNALKAWTNIYATPAQSKEFLETVPTLPNGVAFMWSPSWLGIFQKVSIRKKHTFDSSRTPKPGEQPVEPKARRKPDLTKLTAQIKASAERAKENDPAELKKQLAAAKIELAKSAKALLPAKPVEKVIEKIVEKPVITDKQVTQLLKLRDRSARYNQQCDKLMTDMIRNESDLLDTLSGIVQKAMGTTGRSGGIIKTMPVKIPSAIKHSVSGDPFEAELQKVSKAKLPLPDWPGRAYDNGQTFTVSPKILQVTPTFSKPSTDGVKIDKCGKAIMAVLANYPEGKLIGSIAKLAGYSASGSFKNSLSDLRTAGFIAGRNTEIMTLTEAGHAQGPFDPLPTGQDLVNHWLTFPHFDKCARAILGVLVANPEGFAIDELAEKSGYTASGSFKNSLSDLRTAGVIEGKNTGVMTASPELLEAANAH